METKKEEIIFQNITEASIEGIKQFFITQLDEIVLPYIYKNKLMFLDQPNSIYQEYLSISADTNNLSIIFSNTELDQDNKNKVINDTLVALYTRLKNLIIRIDSEKKSNDFNVNKIK